MFALLPTRMIVVKLEDGSLWINSPVAMPAETIEHIRGMGPVKYLVAPTSLHAWRLAPWHAMFPQAQLVGPGDSPPRAWADDLDQVIFRGNAFIEEAEFLHKPSRTLIVTDFIQNYRPIDGDVFGNVTKWLGGVLNGGVPLDIRLSFTDKKLARECLEKLLSWDFDKLILAHGLCVERNARPFVERRFRWLSG